MDRAGIVGWQGSQVAMKSRCSERARKSTLPLAGSRDASLDPVFLVCYNLSNRFLKRFQQDE